MVRRQGLSLDVVRKNLREQLMISKVIRRKVSSRASMTEGEIDRFLEVNRQKLEIGLDAREPLEGERLQRLRRHLRDVLFRKKYEARLEAWREEIKQRAVIEVRAIEAQPVLPTRVAAARTAVEGAGANPYLRALYARIQPFWVYPCCDGRAAELTVEISLHADGRLASVKVLRSSGFAAYDDSAVWAVKLASPFDALPPDLEGAGLPARIEVRFNYVLSR